MKKSSIVVGIIVLAILGAGLWFISKPTDKTKETDTTTTSSNQNQQTAQEESSNDTTTEPSTESDSSATFTTAEVATHNSRSDCWTIINNNVYNLTSFISSHEGGDNILSACGKDATSYFNGDQPGAMGGSNDHSNDSQALSQLASLKIGSLKD